MKDAEPPGLFVRSPDQELLLALDTVAKRAVEQSLAQELGGGYVLYSGGIDSSILAALVSSIETGTGEESSGRKKGRWRLFTLGLGTSQDIRDSRTWDQSVLPFSSSMKSVIKEVDQGAIEEAARQVQKLVSVQRVSHFEDCTAFYLICGEVMKLKEGEEQEEPLLLSANGPDELFCGYDRFRRIVDREGYDRAKEEIANSLESARILSAQVDRVAEHFGVRVKQPFLQSEFVDFCLEQIPIELKISKGDDMIRKRIWREYGRRIIGLPEEVVQKPKKAMQYSMGIHQILCRMMKRGELRLDLKKREDGSVSAPHKTDTAL